MVRTTAIALLFLVGCATQEPSIIKVPVVQHREPPQALLEPVQPPVGDVFISPSSKDAVVAMSKEGKDKLVEYIDRLARQLEAWRAWAGA